MNSIFILWGVPALWPELFQRKKYVLSEAVPKLQFWNSNLRFTRKSGL
jgi:hypothetical protein